MLSFFATKYTGKVWGDLDSWMYSFHSWSSTNTCTFSLSSLDNEYTFPFLGTNPSLSSIVWSQAFHTGICSDFSLPNTFFYFQNLLSTSSSTVFSSSIFLIWFPGFSFHIWVDIMSFVLFSFPNQSPGYGLPAIVFLVSPPSFLGYTHPSVLFLHAL